MIASTISLRLTRFASASNKSPISVTVIWMSMVAVWISPTRAQDFRETVKQAVPRLVYLRCFPSDEQPELPAPDKAAPDKAVEGDASEGESTQSNAVLGGEPRSDSMSIMQMGFLYGDRFIVTIESHPGYQWQIEMPDGNWIDAPLAGHDQLTGLVVLRDPRPDAPELKPLVEGHSELALPVVATWLAEGIPQAATSLVTCNGSPQLRGMASLGSTATSIEKGAPVLNEAGELLGVVNHLRTASVNRVTTSKAPNGVFMLTLEDDSQMVDLIAPSATIRRLINAAQQSSDPVVLRYGFMGIRVDTETGKIQTVFENGPAAISGLKAGDRIVSINHEVVSEQQPMFSILQNFRAGDVLNLSIERTREDRSLESLTMEITLRPMDLSQFNIATSPKENGEANNGVTLRKIPRDGGPVIAGSPSAVSPTTVVPPPQPGDAQSDPVSQEMIRALQEQMQRRLNQLPPEIVVERSDLESQILLLRREIEALRQELRERETPAPTND